MSKYTTEVRYICEVAAGLSESVGYDGVNAVIAEAAPVIFDFDFPIFDENYRDILERKILKHFYTREIGYETVGLWKLKLDTRLNEIMPYYNKLYDTTLYEFNPLYDVDYYKSGMGNKSETNSGTDSTVKTYDTEEERTIEDDKTKSTTGSGSGTNSEQGTSTNTDATTDLYSDTPQGAIITTETTPHAVVQYMTNARKVDETHNKSYNKSGSNSNQYSESGTESTDRTDTNVKTGTVTDALTHGKKVVGINEYTDHVFGKMSTVPYSKLIMDFRKALLNIDMMIINDLNDLFFGLLE